MNFFEVLSTVCESITEFKLPYDIQMQTDASTSYTTATIDLGGGVYISIQRQSNDEVGVVKTRSVIYSFTYEDIDETLGNAVFAAIRERSIGVRYAHKA